MTDPYIQQQLSAKTAKRSLKPNNGNTQDLLPTTTVLIEMNAAVSEVMVGNSKFRTKIYIPRPMQCKRCFRFGHTAKLCKSGQEVCGHCGVKGHPTASCQHANDASKVRCINCEGNHQSQSASCPKYQLTQAALKVRAQLHFLFHQKGEAARR